MNICHDTLDITLLYYYKYKDTRARLPRVELYLV